MSRDHQALAANETAEGAGVHALLAERAPGPVRDQDQARDRLGERRQDNVANLSVLLLDGAVERPVGGEALEDQRLLHRDTPDPGGQERSIARPVGAPVEGPVR